MLYVFFSKDDKFSINALSKISLNLEINKPYKYSNDCYFILVQNFLYLTEKELENLLMQFDKSNYNIVVVSKHSSKNSSDNAITLHYTGNFTDALYGGSKNTLSYSDNNVLNQIFCNLYEDLSNNSRVFKKEELFLEATHHGPCSNYMHCFFELGSCDKAYDDQLLIDYYVDILLKFINSYKHNASSNNFFLIGAGHYLNYIDYSKFRAKIREQLGIENANIGHIMPKYIISQIIEDRELAKKLILEGIVKSKANIVYVNRSFVKQFSVIKDIVEQIRKEGLEINIIYD